MVDNVVSILVARVSKTGYTGWTIPLKSPSLQPRIIFYSPQTSSEKQKRRLHPPPFAPHQLSSFLKDERGAKLGDRVAALENKLEAAAASRHSSTSGSATEVSATQKRKFLGRLLRQAVILRDTLVIEGIVEEPGAPRGEEACWAGEDRPGGGVDEQVDEDLIRRALGRCHEIGVM